MNEEDDEGRGGTQSEAGSRPQKAGEAGTTRFGMEDGDNNDVPATGGPQADEAEEGSGG